MTSITIRPLSGHDAEAAWQIHRQVQPKPWSLATFCDCTTHPYQALAAYEHGVIGYALLLFVADEGTLMDIAVNSECRGRGVGAQLLHAAISASEQAGMATLWLEVRASNVIARQLYQVNYFDEIEVRKGYYDSPQGKEDAVIMKRTLQASMRT